MRRQGQGQDDEQAVAEVADKRDLALADGDTRDQQQKHRDCREPAEMAVGQCQAVAEGKQGQKRPWQGNHLKSLSRNLRCIPNPVGASLLAIAY
ncbi:hypothetical protein D3C87_1398510 [compost metagenome]